MSDAAWRPSATLASLHKRAATLAAIRGYFADTQALEVTTPVIVNVPSSEPSLQNFALTQATPAYLRTSPESALKRLVAADSGDIFEIGPAFRADERGRLHLTEFTLLEWYRVGFDHHALMHDVAALLQCVGLRGSPQKISYAELFAQQFGAPPAALATTELMAHAARLPIELSAADCLDRAYLFDLLYAHHLEPRLVELGSVFLYDFPPELRAYARLSAATGLAARFELIIAGVEIANGYHEITDAEEQAQCFAADNARRRARGLAAVEVDSAWLQALRHGLPAVAGVALGIERLLLTLQRLDDVQQVFAFAPATI